MGYLVVKKSITDIEADVLINASNGIGFMGGTLGRFIKLKGVAEAIHYATGGIVEREAKIASRKSKYLPSFINGHKPGEIFITGAGNLKASSILHAVTMRYPSMPTNIDTVRTLLPKILNEARSLNAKSLAIPLLGTGTGGLDKNDVLNMYEEFFKDVKDIKALVCCM